MAKIKKGLLTIAIGKKYITQAKYLAYSCMLHTPHTVRAVITDNPTLLSGYYDILIPYNPEYGDPFAAKTMLHRYTPFEKTLYLDADSLVMTGIDSYWEVLEDRSFAYTGELIKNGEWYFDIEKIMDKLSLPWIPKLNSGMLLFDTGEKSKAVFDTANDYMQNHDELAVPFFREKMLPDEPYFAIALAKQGETPYADHGRFSRTLIGADHIRLDSIKGFAFFIKKGEQVFPQVVHFCGRFGQFFYLFEKIKLYFCFNPPVKVFFNGIFSVIRNIVKK
ncbi:hypothetical protein [Treponema primitia]|uniref:hypothetical protein n=1 Tax=Treponema primitia TaxID=88058 RepID=UPI00025556A5|nr:hypothetical protein [Treponema primitia]